MLAVARPAGRAAPSATWSLAIAGAAALCGLGVVLLVLGSDHFTDRAVWAVFAPIVGWSFVGTGLYAWSRRPDSRFGLLMVVLGFAWFLGPLPASHIPLVFTLGISLGALWGAVFGHVLLSFPTGRLASPARRRTVIASYLIVTLAPVPALLVSDSEDVIGACEGPCPENAFLISHNESLSEILLAAGGLATVVICLVAVGMLVRQWRTAGPPERRSLAPLFGAGILMLAFITAYSATRAPALLWIAFAAFALTPLAFLAGLARADVTRSRAVRRLMAELADVPEREDLRDTLARALGDPTLELAFWMPDQQAYVDAAGQPFAALPAEADAARMTTEIEHDGRRLAAIVHDRALGDEQETVQAAGSAAALLLENRRMDAELKARLVELRASRARLVTAGDAERRRLERNLHDGAQSRLVALALSLRLARGKVDAGSEVAGMLDTSIDELQLSLAELRELARGIHPPMLSEQGLEAAVRGLAARAPVPVELLGTSTGTLPAAIETAAYFVVAEALTNVSKYAQAEHATVRVERVNGRLLVEVSDDGVGGASANGGSGLRGLSDRVSALSGTLELSSPPGQGTRVSAHLPCT